VSRPESQAVAGFYATPAHLVPRIARLVSADWGGEDWNSRREIAFLDPCAGEGVIFDLIDALRGESKHGSARVYACEMEQKRFKATDQRRWGTKCDADLVHGDAFRVSFRRENRSGIALLFLNPPYDPDPEYGRLEEKFLRRFTPTLATDGVLLFLVPYYAVSASAATLAQHFDSLACFRFPGSDFDAFKQVVLVARRSASLLEPDPALVAQIEAWSRDAESIPELPEQPEPLLALPSSSYYGSGLDASRGIALGVRAVDCDRPSRPPSPHRWHCSRSTRRSGFSHGDASPPRSHRCGDRGRSVRRRED
jgi:hypothetical protein